MKLNENVNISNSLFECLKVRDLCAEIAVECIENKITHYSKRIFFKYLNVNHKSENELTDFYYALNDLMREVLKKDRPCNAFYIELINFIRVKISELIKYEKEVLNRT